MSFKLNLKYLLSFLTVLSTLALTGNQTVAKNRFPTTFHCISQRDGSLVTVARRGRRQTSPLFIWKSTGWGPKYPPQKRCRIVGQRLTKAVAANGGKLSGLYMTHGIVNKYPVICYIDDPNGGCTSSNILLTLPLSEKSVRKRNEVLRSIAEFSKKGTGSALTRGVFSVDMEDINNAFTESTVDKSSNTQTFPNTTPIVPTRKTIPSSQTPEEDMSI
ncbi:COP23 domain-containing protein [Calothrix rhizosoleniae]|uniref:COP23 domain-containing protein n=1 Tax=Calothrix rhizosoleniae TaxID=888997 RepID=UPI000B4A223F|nr:COP23 domain-containing protein [Calothrix rhizosoleniae]